MAAADERQVIDVEEDLRACASRKKELKTLSKKLVTDVNDAKTRIDEELRALQATGGADEFGDDSEAAHAVASSKIRDAKRVYRSAFEARKQAQMELVHVDARRNIWSDYSARFGPPGRWAASRLARHAVGLDERVGLAASAATASVYRRCSSEDGLLPPIKFGLRAMSVWTTTFHRLSAGRPCGAVAGRVHSAVSIVPAPFVSNRTVFLPEPTFLFEVRCLFPAWCSSSSAAAGKYARSAAAWSKGLTRTTMHVMSSR